uniref:Uncharacterized protein n=1 Tax=Spongospora subterranea TaxID=70186 RepID=A0A0H5R8T8_9EUKA|eukprot:CRZ10206.1 hypothetical protein [Spongospora subterranea]
MINALGIKGNKVIGNTYSVPPRPPTSTPWVVISPGSGLSLFGLSASASPFHQSGKFSSILSHYKLGQIPNIHGARVIICWNTEWSRKFEQCIAHDLAILGADQVAFIPSPLLTTLASKQPSNTVLVINIGFRHVSVSPVCFGQIFTWAQTVLSSSFLDIFTDYADLPKSDIIESAIVEFVKKLGIYNVYEVRDYRESTREMPLKDNNGTSIKQISYGLMQVVLNDFMDDMCDIVLESLSRCPIDCRRPLSRSIALSGGMALIPGIQQKFMHCMSQKISNDPSRAYLRGLIHTFRFVKSSFPVEHLEWIGACILSQIGVPHQSVMTNEQCLDPRLNITNLQSQSTSFVKKSREEGCKVVISKLR